MTNKIHVSIIIPTYKRAHLLKYVLDGLLNQNYRDFEVLTVIKPSGDNSEGVVKKYKKCLNLKLIIQEKGYFTDALNLGLKHARGDVIAFLDDDAIPLPNWLTEHIKLYANPNIGGVAGNVIPATLNGRELKPFNENASQIIPNHKSSLENVGRKLWSRPLEKLEDYLVYISKAGIVEYNSNLSKYARYHITNSLLGMGANMSVLSRAVKNFSFPNSWILGLSNEQFLGWHIWRKGYNLVFNPHAKVYHIIHDQTLSRKIKETKKDVLRIVEYNLLFYQLRNLEKNFSWTHRITWLMFINLLSLKKICLDKEVKQIAKIKGTFFSEIIGIKWLISRKFSGRYSPLIDLKRIAG
ncbi:MAG: glycosyltransferase family 2 protein [Candidatus Bathyarchaeia archaeon]